MILKARPCGICGNIAVGRLIDQNDHTWHICAECIASLWEKRQAENMSREQEANAIGYVLGKLAALLTKED